MTVKKDYIILFIFQACIHGYEYDKTWFQSTIVTEYDWVCDKVFYKPNAFVFDRIGEVIGTFIFGQLGDA